MNWDRTADVVVIGTGAAGLGAALTAKANGLEPLVLEASRLVGGSTVLAGGGIWVPFNHFMRDARIPDSEDQAIRYLDAIVGEGGRASSPARRRTYVETAWRAIEFFEQQGIRFRRTPNYPDYHPDMPGASVAGRGIESAVFDMNLIGEWGSRMVKRIFPRTMPMGTLDVANMVLAARMPRGVATYLRVVLHHLRGKAAGKSLAGGGAALVGQLLYQLKSRGVDIWTESPALELVTEDGRIAGVVAEHEGRQVRIAALHGVHLGGGGFARNPEMRRAHQPGPVDGAWTSASPSDQGTAIKLGLSAGAAVELMDEAWWGPASVLPNGAAMFHVSERSKPGSLIVDQSAKRYMNEAQSYVDAVHAMFERDRSVKAIPSWLIFDQRYRNRYPFGMLLPRRTPEELVEQGYFKRAGSIGELAALCDVDPAALQATVDRFNRMARNGVDEDFGRGADAYDRYFGDPTVKPNPTMAELLKPPFYAVGLVPGDLGTKGGLVTDEDGRVLREDGNAIAGLYASGNTTASVMGRRYPGPGVTLGPALTFSYRAMRHAASQARKNSTVPAAKVA